MLQTVLPIQGAGFTHGQVARLVLNHSQVLYPATAEGEVTFASPETQSSIIKSTGLPAFIIKIAKAW